MKTLEQIEGWSWRHGPRLCSFGIVEGALLAVGVGAATASTIAAVAGPALIGSGLGAASAAVTGGNIGQGALFGGLTGGALGGAGVLFPETMGAIGLGPATATMGADGNWVPGAGGFANAPATAGLGGGLASAEQIASEIPGGSPALGMSTADQIASQIPGGSPALNAPAGSGGGVSAGAGSSTAGAGGSGGGGGGGALAQAAKNSGSGLTNTLKALGAAGNLVGAFMPKGAPNYGITPGPSTTAATQGPLFNQTLPTPGQFINRTPVQNYQPINNDWYHYGEVGNQPLFYNNNQLTMPGVPGMAKGGALRGGMDDDDTFDPNDGDNYVQGDGGGQDDTVNARLSPGEFVWDAATVSAVGDGNSNEGAKRLYQARRDILAEKGAKVTPPPLKRPVAHYLQRR